MWCADEEKSSLLPSLLIEALGPLAAFGSSPNDRIFNSDVFGHMMQEVQKVRERLDFVGILSSNVGLGIRCSGAIELLNQLCSTSRHLHIGSRKDAAPSVDLALPPILADCEWRKMSAEEGEASKRDQSGQQMRQPALQEDSPCSRTRIWSPSSNERSSAGS